MHKTISFIFLTKKSKFISLLFLFAFTWSLMGQEGKKIKVEILSAKSLKAGKSKNHQKLVGDVVLRQDDVKLYCDSAEINQLNNDFEAWGKVFINKNDSVKAWGDSLKYSGATETAMLMGNAKLVKEGTELTTSVLYLDQKKDLYYYLTPAVIKSDETTITSGIGYYYIATNMITFRKDVVVTHPDYTIKADTMNYYAKSEKVVFHGPTNILLENDTIYCERGYYNPNNKMSEFRQNAKVIGEESTLEADSIVVDQEKEISKSYGNVSVIDTVNKVTITGHYGYFDQKNNLSFVTDSALFIQYMDNDTMYLHGDTIRAVEDSLEQKSFYVYCNVRMFKKDMQAVCDSLTYGFSDSLIKLFRDPVVWNGKNQLTGDTISILSFDNKLHKMFITGNSKIISLTDSIYDFYDQIKGRNMVGYFKDGKMDVMDVLGNGQTLYYAKEEDSTYTGVNKAECSNIKISFKDSEIHKIMFLTEPVATFYPLNQFPASESKMDGFMWFDKLKPVRKSDVFRSNDSLKAN
ncbi:MAG: lipopolysaccharide transport protein LptA [Saprospiraceae bacterium]|jgi:lipopolysaccharide transport protein LptA